MKVELLYIRDCPNHKRTVEMVRDVLRENGLPLDIFEIVISTPAEAIGFSFPGSPTVRVDGVDVEPGSATPCDFAVTCRTYLVNGARQGAPDREWIRKAIRRNVES